MAGTWGLLGTARPERKAAEHGSALQNEQAAGRPGATVERYSTPRRINGLIALNPTTGTELCAAFPLEVIL